MERNLALEVVRATEAAALAAARFIGKGDERMADRAACDAMRKTLNSVAMDGKIVIGEGKEGDAEFLYEGEIVGTGAGTEIDVALDAIEGPIICATGGPNALSCVALAERGRILRCPDTYMDKVACGPAGRGVIDIDRSPTDNLKALAEAKKVYVEDLRVAILLMPDHATPSQLKTHSSEPVPFALMTSAQFKPGGSTPRRYTEDDGTATGVLVGDGYHLIESLFGSALKTTSN